MSSDESWKKVFKHRDQVEDYCPICGEKLGEAHKCRESVLRAIDRAHNRDEDTVHFSPSEAERLSEGMRMLGAEEY